VVGLPTLWKTERKPNKRHSTLKANHVAEGGRGGRNVKIQGVFT